MESGVLALAPDAFVRLLTNKSKQWRRRNGGSSAKRHARNLRRAWIRDYKRRHGLQSLPLPTATKFTAAETMVDVSADDAVLLVLPSTVTLEELGDTDAPEEGEDRPLENHPVVDSARKELRRLLHRAKGEKPNVAFELIHAGHSGHQSLPPVARVRRGKQLQLRGVFMEALGVAVLPRLEPGMAEIFTAAGAEVLPNTDILVSQPEIRPLSSAPDFWHRRILPKGGNDPQTFTGKGVSVGVLDTGIDDSHPEFAHLDVLYREFDELGIEVEGAPTRDFGNHGTHVCGLCAGKTAGLAPNVHLSVAAVLTSVGPEGQLGCKLLQLVGGLNWLADQAGANGDGVHIINASLGAENFPRKDISFLYESVCGAADRGAVVVAAIGNSGRSGAGHHSFPAKFGNVIGVGAIDEKGGIAPFSDWGRVYGQPKRDKHRTKPDLVAPGVEVHSAAAGGGYVAMSGSSMSAPLVSAGLALLLEARKELAGDVSRLTDSLMQFTEYKEFWSKYDRLKVGCGSLTLGGLDP